MKIEKLYMKIENYIKTKWKLKILNNKIKIEKNFFLNFSS